MSIHRVGNTIDVTTPAWLYELLPLIYIIAGAWVGLKLEGLLAVLSSALLILTGLQIFRLRGRYRKSLRHPQHAPISNHR